MVFGELSKFHAYKVKNFCLKQSQREILRRRLLPQWLQYQAERSQRRRSVQLAFRFTAMRRYAVDLASFNDKHANAISYLTGFEIHKQFSAACRFE